MCYVELYNTHKCSDFNKADDDFDKQMTCDVDNIAAGVKKCREMSQSVEKEKTVVIGQVAQVRNEVDEKLMIDVYREKMSQLSSVKQRSMKETWDFPSVIWFIGIDSGEREYNVSKTHNGWDTLMSVDAYLPLRPKFLHVVCIAYVHMVLWHKAINNSIYSPNKWQT